MQPFKQRVVLAQLGISGDVLRIGLGLYHDLTDVEAFSALAARLS